ncbi:MAG: N-acetyl-gamma-glutamyl-phosphate reductase [Bacteroidetes bacterium]|nr:N-acetyl-gamma-glutamyl-phosphate reductase [Bacteroidota bacterium]
MKKIKAGIIGGAGYTGGEVLRLLMVHPSVEISFVHSRSNDGKEVSQIHQDLAGLSSLRFTNVIDTAVDVLFLCLGHGESRQLLEKLSLPDHLRIIDLTNDFRLKNNNQLGNRTFTYGLPELNKELIKKATSIANPGCFATAIQLSLLPLAEAGLLAEVHTTGITGSTGAGQTLATTSHFSWRENNIQAYKTLTHQHLDEIAESLGQSMNKTAPAVHFVPWRGDFTRGIFCSSTIAVSTDLEELIELFNTYYQSHPFVHVSQNPIFLKQVVGTNRALLQLEKQGHQLVVHCVIDNLLKGAAGQAVQNMNLLFDLDEQCGLQLKANYF